MANRETNITNAAESTLSSSQSSSDTTINVTDTSSFPSVPFYAVIDPDVDAKREIIYVDSSTTATTFVLSATSSRGVDGTTATSHDSGAKVAIVPIAAWWTDINDRVDAAGDLSAGDNETITGSWTFSTDPTLADGSSAVSATEQTAALADYVELAGDTMSGELNLADNLLTRPKLKDWSEEQTTPSVSAGALTLDLTNGNVFEVSLTGNVTSLTISNPPATGDAGAFTLIVKQDATGSRTVTWPAAVKWAAGTAPTLSTAANAIDIITFITTDAGTAWYGMVAGQAFA